MRGYQFEREAPRSSFNPERTLRGDGVDALSSDKNSAYTACVARGSWFEPKEVSVYGGGVMRERV
jgi:hypothetical protein